MDIFTKENCVGHFGMTAMRLIVRVKIYSAMERPLNLLGMDGAHI